MSGQITVYGEDYPSRQLLDLIGDKWTPIVLFILGQGTKRYGEMQRHLPDVSKKMLTQTLRALEQDGLLSRKVYPVVPPKVEYSLTKLGAVFLEPVTALCRWAQAHEPDLAKAHASRTKARRRRPRAGCCRRKGGRWHWWRGWSRPARWSVRCSRRGPGR